MSHAKKIKKARGETSCHTHAVKRDAWKESNVVYVLGLDNRVIEAIFWTDAVTNILQGKMTPFMVHPTKRVRSANGTVDMAHPLIVRLNFWVNIPFREPPKPTSKASSAQILRRDRYTCRYCGEYATTADHVKPRSICIKDKDPYEGCTWDNLVAACWDCNQKKRNRYPEEAGMKELWKTRGTGDHKFALIQAEVDKITATGEGYAVEPNVVEGLIK